MTKLIWQARDDQPTGYGPARIVPLPFVSQGVRDALRNAYSAQICAMPDDLALLLHKLR